MPWCANCDRFLSPATVQADGTCPSCGRVVEAGRAHAPDPATPGAAVGRAGIGASPPAPAGAVVDDDDDDRPPIPWHLWLLLAALAVYLGYRAFQGLEWIFGI